MSTTTVITTTDNKSLTVTVNEKGFYDEIEIEDLEFNEENETFYYPCPCGDRFQITLQDLKNGEEVATCPSCSLIVRVIYSPEDLEEVDDDE